MLEVRNLKGAKFGTNRRYVAPGGYAIYDTERGGYWAFSAQRDKYGILCPYALNKKKTMQGILDDGGFVSYEGMEIVKPFA